MLDAELPAGPEKPSASAVDAAAAVKSAGGGSPPWSGHSAEL